MLLALAVAAALTTVNVPDTLGGDRIEKAEASSGLSVLLPENLDTEFKKVYGNRVRVKNGYALAIGASSGCEGQSVCGVANFAFDSDPPSGGKKVKLAKGRTGHFVESMCGANCTFPQISWRERDATYTIQYKEAGGVKDLKALANSAIKAGPR